DVEGDAAERSFRKTGLQACPVFAAVGGLPDAAAGAAAVHAARGASALIRGGVEDLIIRRIHHEIVRARVVVCFQHLVPRLATVGRFVHAALAARSPEAAGRGDEYGVVVPRIDRDAVDMAR